MLQEFGQYFVQRCLDQMQVDFIELHPMPTSLSILQDMRSSRWGHISLLLSLREEPLRWTQIITFIVVEASSSYNVILGRPIISLFQAIVFTYHQKIKFPVRNQISKVKGDQSTARKCYVEIVCSSQKKARGRIEKHQCQEERGAGIQVLQDLPMFGLIGGELEEIQLVPSQSNRTIWVVVDLSLEVKHKLITCLSRNKNVFAWSVQKIRGISLKIMEHKLNILAEARSVKQKKRYFGLEKDKVIRAEITKLLEAGYIREVQFPTWLEIIVLVLKPGGRWRACVDF